MLQTIEDQEPRKHRVNRYAFIICLGGFLTQFIVLTCQRLPAVSMESIRETLGVSYAEVGLITSFYMIFYAGLSLFWGWLADKRGARFSLSLACLVAGAGTILFGLTAHLGLPVAIATWCVTGFGTAGLLMAVIPKLVAKWFAPNKRGFGMALIMPGANVASMVLGVAAPVIIAASGWQMGFVYFGVGFLAIAVVVFLCVKDDPASMGLAPFGAPAGTQAAPAPVMEARQAAGANMGESALKRVVKMPLTWRFGIMYIIFQVGYMAATQYYVVSVQSVGFSLAEASLGLTWAGICTIVAEQIFGNLSDRVERKNVIAVASVLCGVFGFGYFLVLVNGTPSLLVCYVFVSLITACTGIVTVIMTAAGDIYPADIRGTGTGFISTLCIVGRYLGPWVAGLAVDATLQTGYAYLIVGVMMVIAGVVAFTLPRLRGTAASLT